jgi:hypothetical protein
VRACSLVSPKRDRRSCIRLVLDREVAEIIFLLFLQRGHQRCQLVRLSLVASISDAWGEAACKVESETLTRRFSSASFSAARFNLALFGIVDQRYTCTTVFRVHDVNNALLRRSGRALLTQFLKGHFFDHVVGSGLVSIEVSFPQCTQRNASYAINHPPPTDSSNTPPIIPNFKKRCQSEGCSPVIKCCPSSHIFPQTISSFRVLWKFAVVHANRVPSVVCTLSSLIDRAGKTRAPRTRPAPVLWRTRPVI